MKRVLIVVLCIFINIFPSFAEESDVLIKETYKLQGQIEYDDNPLEVIYLDEDITNSLEKIINLNPEHVSVYSLILEEGTVLENKVSKGILKLPDEKIEREMYWNVKNT